MARSGWKIVNGVVAAIAITLAGCGYYNPYVAHQGQRPIAVYRAMWSNRTTEVGLDNTLFQSQSDWLRKSPLISLTDSTGLADYELTGSIDRVTYPEISFGQYREGTQGRAELTVSFTVKERKSGQIVWKKSAYSRQREFYMSQDLMQMQLNKRVALQRIADDIAEEIYLYLINTMMRPAPAGDTAGR